MYNIYIYTYMRHTVDGKITSVFFGGHFWVKFWDSRHVQWSKYIVFHEESDFQVKNKQFLEPEGKNKENRN